YLWGKEAVAGNIDAIARRKQDMINASCASILELNANLVAFRSRGNHGGPRCYSQALDPRYQPSGASRPDRNIGSLLLPWDRQLFKEIGPCNDVTQDRGSDVRHRMKRIEHRFQRVVLTFPPHVAPKPANLLAAHE